MLSIAVTLAILGFAALVVALWAGSLAWAWVCVCIAALGVILFIIDLVRHGRSRR